MIDKKVSVIIPTYNRASLVKEAIESVLSQTYDNFEIIVIDDGSTDNTRELLGPYKNKINYIFMKNMGVSAARNEGIKKSKGDYITFLDSDDLWSANKLEEEIKYFDENPKAKVCYTDEIWFRNGARVNPRKKHYKPSGEIFLELLPLCRISASSIMIKREVIEDIGLFDDTMPVCEDYDYWLRIALKYTICFIDQPLIIKRNGLGQNLSQMYCGMDMFRVKSMENILKNNKVINEYKKEIFNEIIKKSKILKGGAIKRGKMFRFIKYFYKNLYYSNKLRIINND